MVVHLLCIRRECDEVESRVGITYFQCIVVLCNYLSSLGSGP